MMMNLFSIFDPYINYLNFNWISSIYILVIMPQFYWFMKSYYMMFYINFINILINEFYIILKFKFNLNNMIFFITLFFFILLNNFMGLFPYIFTSSSHMIFSISFSLSMWNGYMLFGWLKNTNFMMIHMVPQGTPYILMNFMVLIELLSMIIRPLTLSIRLAANMIAGHLLLTLLGTFIVNLIKFYLLILIVQLLLLILEMAVSVIQSYVFVLLTLLYLKETN